jgi:hypothetical protein
VVLGLDFGFGFCFGFYFGWPGFGLGLLFLFELGLVLSRDWVLVWVWTLVSGVGSCFVWAVACFLFVGWFGFVLVGFEFVWVWVLGVCFGLFRFELCWVGLCLFGFALGSRFGS